MSRAFEYASNIAWIGAERLLRMVVSVFLLAYVARYLGPERFGLLNYAVAIVALTAPLIALGLNRLLVRELVRTDSEGELLGTVFSMKLAASVTSVLALALASLYSGWVAEEAAMLIMVASLGNLFTAFDVVDFYFQSHVRAKYTAIYKSIAFVITSGVKFGLVMAEAPLLLFAAAHALEWAMIAGLGLAAYLRYSQGSSPWEVRAERSRYLLRESWPEIIAGVAIVLCMRLDQIMLEELLNIEAVGIYSAATRLSDLWYFVPAAIASSVFPAIIKSREKSVSTYHSDLQKLFLVSVAVSYAIAFATVILAPYLIAIMFGTEYSAASSILATHIWTVVAVTLGVCSGSWIFAEARIILSLYRSVIGAAVNATLNWTLIPIFGAQGAAIATLVSLFAAFYLFDLAVPSMRHIFWMKTRAILLIGSLDYCRELMARTRS